ncbi:FAD-binding domain-containing protein [Pholiota conissans]|uniref:FAD-binding domain-containing protein n=1 Tax=Pholiota conissans TaxID=109636 RepID=A0A9P6CVY6_9AGAR|nr:FAD-binding domain-containing protein [Pholiota conissans]
MRTTDLIIAFSLLSTAKGVVTDAAASPHSFKLDLHVPNPIPNTNTFLRSSKPPAANKWAVLNATLGGRLQVSQPFARPCFQASDTVGAFNQGTCGAVQAGYLNHTVRVQAFGSFMNTEWEGCQATSEQCTLDWQNPVNPAAFSPPSTCSQGSIAEVFLEVKNAADVQTAFKFSKQSGVPLSIKNTGHDYSGRSSQIGSLGLWTHNLNSISFSEKFVPKGCPASKALPGVTQGAGVVHGDIVNFADAHGLTMPAGADNTVGAVGGFLMGGGHTPVSNIYGLGVDRVLEFEVVTPTGKHLFANDCQNTDLFFALRGGGGATFGVVLAVTMRAFPKTSFTTVGVTFNNAPAVLSPFLDLLIGHSVQWATDGWSGVIVLGGGMFLTNTKMNQAAAAKYMAPLQNAVEKQLNGTFTLVTLPSYLALHQNFITSQAVPVGIPLLTSSRLIPANTFKSSPTQLRDALLNITANSVETILFADTPFSFKPFAGTGPTSVTPAWRNSIWHVTSGNGWLFNTPTAGKQAVYTGVTELMQLLRDLTPSSGAYHNEADVHEPNFSSSFWGNNYARLLSIKRKYDPDHLLDCWRCVNWRGASNANFRCYL